MIKKDFIPYKIRLAVEKELFFCEEKILEIENIDIVFKYLVYYRVINDGNKNDTI